MPPAPLETNPIDRLTPIQREIFVLLARGFPSSNLIGRRMNMNPKRIDKHIATVCGRLGVSDRRSALAKLIELEKLARENHPPGERLSLFDLDHTGLYLDVLKSGRRPNAVEKEVLARDERPAVPSQQERHHAPDDLGSARRGAFEFGEWIGAERSDPGVGGVHGAQRPLAAAADDPGTGSARRGRDRGGAESLFDSGRPLIAALGVWRWPLLIVVIASAMGLLFTISVFAMRLMLPLLQGTPIL